MKRLISLLIIVALVFGALTAYADEYVLYKPSENQLREEEALQIACDYLHELTGVEMTEI